MHYFAIFSTPTNGLLWLGESESLRDAVLSLNRDTAIAETQPSEDEDFISVVSVTPAEAKILDSLEWGAPLPELAEEFTHISYTEALSLIEGPN